MPRVRHEIHPFIQALMDRHGAGTVKELSDSTGIPYTTLIHYADVGKDWTRYKSLIKNAEQMGLTVDELVRGLCSA